ncbi:MAG: cystathionine gamma-lyase [Thermoplasmata archaeon]
MPSREPCPGGPSSKGSGAGPSTRSIHAGTLPPRQGAPFLPGPVFASKFHLAGDPASSRYTYGRDTNPTWDRFEEALAELEGGPSLVFASGMAAVTAALSVGLSRAGRRSPLLVMSSDGYNLARTLVEEHFVPRGARVRYVPTRTPAESWPLRGATLVWVESPSNPGLDVCDLRLLARRAHAAGAAVAVDNTTPTPLGQRPLALGADLSVASDSKSLTGHSDLVLGHVAARDAGWADRIRRFRKLEGAIAGPMETWLAHRSLATLALRIERQGANALAIARFLKERPDVRDVRYPGLEDDPSHRLAAAQMAFFGPIVSFTLPDAAAADRFLAACRIVRTATSFGGVHTTAERRARWNNGDAVPPGFVRLSAGCEDPSDLLRDLDRALRMSRSRARGAFRRR